MFLYLLAGKQQEIFLITFFYLSRFYCQHSYCVYCYYLCARFVLESWLLHPNLQRVLTDMWRTRLSRCHMIGLLPHLSPPPMSVTRPATHRKTEKESQHTGGSVGEGVGHNDEKAWSSKSFNTLWRLLFYDVLLAKPWTGKTSRSLWTRRMSLSKRIE